MDVSAQISDELDPTTFKEWRSPARVAKCTDEEKVEFFLSCGWPVAKIRRELGGSERALKEIIDRVDARKIREIADGPEVMRARQISYLEQVAAEAMDAYHEKYDRKGRRDPRLFRIGILANEHIRKIAGLDAPKKINYDLADKPAVAPEQQLDMVNAPPELRAKFLANLAEMRRIRQELRDAGGGAHA